MSWEMIAEPNARVRGYRMRELFSWMHDDLMDNGGEELLNWMDWAEAGLNQAFIYFQNGSTINVLDAPLSVRSETVRADEYSCEFYSGDKVEFSEEQFYEMLGVSDQLQDGRDLDLK